MFIFLVSFFGNLLVSEQLNTCVFCIEGVLSLILLLGEILILKRKAWILIPMFTPFFAIKVISAIVTAIAITCIILYPCFKRIKIEDTRAIAFGSNPSKSKKKLLLFIL